MHQKIEIYNDLNKIAMDIVNNIIVPTCGIKVDTVNLWLTDIETYTLDDDKKREQILVAIEERYQLHDHELDYVDSYTTLIQIALFIYLRDRKETSNG